MIQVNGIDKLFLEVNKLQKKLNKKENMALRAGAKPLARAMKQHVSRSKKDQQHIQEDIQISPVKGKEARKWVEVGPGKKTNWRAKFLEFGTSKMSAQPFMGPAEVESRSEVLRAMEHVMKKGITT